MLAAASLVLTQAGEGSSPSSPTSNQTNQIKLNAVGPVLVRAGDSEPSRRRFDSCCRSFTIRKSTGWMRALSRKQVRFIPLWVRVPRLPLNKFVLLAERLGSRFPIWPGGFDSRRALWGSANGRLPAFEAGGEGSIPSPQKYEKSLKATQKNGISL